MQVFTDSWGPFEDDSVVVQPQELMHHGLVGPLGEERRHGVIHAIQNQQQWAFLACKVIYAVALNMPLHFMRNLGGSLRVFLEANMPWFDFHRQKHREDALDGLAEEGGARSPGQGATEIQGQQVLVHGHKICVHFVDLLDDLVVIGFREPLQQGSGHDVAEEKVVLLELGIGELPHQHGDVCLSWPHKHSRLEVRHGLVHGPNLLHEEEVLLEDLGLAVHVGYHLRGERIE
mmetsp:Transcript_20708/g.60519  ORF Transcript_20708/g.60519 Transcript_20708/m.60519 type:complete len:232 (+) Transcript_20708:1086-1781(+)